MIVGKLKTTGIGLCRLASQVPESYTFIYPLGGHDLIIVYMKCQKISGYPIIFHMTSSAENNMTEMSCNVNILQEVFA